MSAIRKSRLDASPALMVSKVSSLSMEQCTCCLPFDPTTLSEHPLTICWTKTSTASRASSPVFRADILPALRADMLPWTGRLTAEVPAEETSLLPSCPPACTVAFEKLRELNRGRFCSARRRMPRMKRSHASAWPNLVVMHSPVCNSNVAQSESGTYPRLRPEASWLDRTFTMSRMGMVRIFESFRILNSSCFCESAHSTS
mmetsp:Transcript_47818/g.95064  ORF Transcript_47818/g.95064 Transcript_47818/m.95064 type:complete len:201 (-) Transcript_47818:243-845(-)